MSDQWIFFPCMIGDTPSWIFFDHGIREKVGTFPDQLLKLRIAFKILQPNAMPINEEFKALSAFEDALSELVQELKSNYVGRITANGHRHFYIYTSGSEEVWSSRLKALSEACGYLIDCVLCEDEGHMKYWEELFPTADDWQVIQDLRVIEELEKKGDDGTASRRIDHWGFFPSESNALQFLRWAEEQGYCSLTTEICKDRKYRVCFSHEGNVQLSEISGHTIALRRKASELGGEYDGWETPILGKFEGEMG